MAVERPVTMGTNTPRRDDDIERAQLLGEWLGGVALATGRRLEGILGCAQPRRAPARAAARAHDHRAQTLA